MSGATDTRRTGAVAILLALATLVILRVPFFGAPMLNVDEALFAVAGRWMAEGAHAYVDFYETKPPGLLGMYWILQTLTPWDLTGARVALLVAHLASSVSIVFICALWKRPAAGLFAAFVYALAVSAGIPRDFQAAESEGFMAAFVACGVAMLLWAIHRQKIVFSAFSGVCFAFALSMKQPAAIDVAGVLIWGGGLAYLDAERRPLIMRSLLAMLGGFATLLAIFGLYYFTIGGMPAVSAVVFNCLTYPLTVYGAAPVEASFAATWLSLGATQPLVFIGGPLALGVAAWARRSRAGDFSQEPLVVLAVWMTAATMGASVGARAYPHYFLQVVAPASLSVGWLLTSWFRAKAGDRGFRLGVLGLALGCASPAIWTHVIQAPKDAGAGAAHLGRWVADHTEGGDRVFIWGFAPEIHYFARRLPAAPDFIGDYMSGWDPALQTKGYEKRHVAEARRRARTRLKQTPPALVVDFSRAGYVSADQVGMADSWRDYTEAKRFRVRWWGNPEGPVIIWRRP